MKLGLNRFKKTKARKERVAGEEKGKEKNQGI